VDIIQPCITFFDTRDDFKEKVYWIGDDFDKSDLKKAMEKVS
jgi:pyruvate/2-oxoacid:ferredoxin oxidoreductase beta subunit